MGAKASASETMIVDPVQLLLFLPAALALNLTPGSDMLFCLAQGMKSGPRAGVAASLGIATGALIHSLLAAFGLAALLAANPLAFEVLRWAGVAYLLYLAVKTLRAGPGGPDLPQRQAGTAFKAWRDGILVNLFNPKVAVFILALVPQFVDPARGATVLQFLIFCAILTINGTVINALVGSFSGSLGKLLTSSRRAKRTFDYLCGAIFLGLAAKLALSER